MSELIHLVQHIGAIVVRLGVIFGLLLLAVGIDIAAVFWFRYISVPKKSVK